MWTLTLRQSKAEAVFPPHLAVTRPCCLLLSEGNGSRNLSWQRQGQGLWGTLLRCWANRLHHVLWRLAKGLFLSPCQIVRSTEDWLESIACKWEVQLYWLLEWIYKNVKNCKKCETLKPHPFQRSWASVLNSTRALNSMTFPKGQCLKSWCVKLSVIYQNVRSCFPFCLSASVNRLLYFSYHFMFKSPKHHNQA